MAERGFIAVDRGVFEHPSFAPEAFTEREAWIWMIAEAAWKPTRVRVGRVQVDVARGQLAYATRFLAAKWRWSEARVRRFLGRLQSDAMVAVLATRDATHITICNFDKYQAGRRTEDAQIDARTDEPATQRRTREQETTSQEAEASFVEPPKRRRSTTAVRAARLTADWALPLDWRAWAIEQGVPESAVEREADRFRDFWVAKAGPNAAKQDWSATWRNWIRKALDEGRLGSARGPPGLLPFASPSRSGQPHAPGTPGPVTPETVDRLKQRIRSSLAGSFDPEAVGDERDHGFAPARRVHSAHGGQH